MLQLSRLVYPIIQPIKSGLKMSGNPTQSIRIIGGKWRSRLLNFPVSEGLRPTGNRIRETLFNWLAPYIEGARCLDVFAGSGALSFEALSRGAECCFALENNAQAVTQLRVNQSALEADNLTLLRVDSEAFLNASNTERPFNIIFLDPPFASDFYGPVSQSLAQKGWLSDGALIYTESPVLEQLKLPTSWQLQKQKTAGEVKYCLYQHVEL